MRENRDPGTGLEGEAGEELWREATSLESVLVVSSDMPSRVSVCDALEEVGYRVRAAAGPADARRVLHAEMPDVLVVDLTGDDPAMRAVGAGAKAVVAPHRLPVLALVRPGGGESAPRPYGIDHALVVPVAMDELRRAVQYLVEPFRVAPATRSPRWAQLAMNLQDRMEPAHLKLGTTFHARVVFDATPLNEPYIAELRGRLAKMAIPAEAELRAGEMEIAFYPTVAEAFALGYNRFAPDELFLALVESYPELGVDPDALQTRIHELEDEYIRAQRRAS